MVPSIPTHIGSPTTHGSTPPTSGSGPAIGALSYILFHRMLIHQVDFIEKNHSKSLLKHIHTCIQTQTETDKRTHTLQIVHFHHTTEP